MSSRRPLIKRISTQYRRDSGLDSGAGTGIGF